MKERPILMSSPMVKAILDGAKTQTRRVVKPQLESLGWNEGWFYKGGYWSHPPERCPYGQPGDRLWVREPFAFAVHDKCGPIADSLIYRADGNEDWDGNWKPSIFMPREASRISLEVTGIRVERLQDISEADALAEGIKPDQVRQMWLFGATNSERDEIYRRAAVRPYSALWDSINAKTAPWASNPWVWVVEFKRID